MRGSTRSSLMYEARAAVLEGTKDYAKADEVFTKGIKLGARRGLRMDAKLGNSAVTTLCGC